jgi:hypothetical protein
MKLIVRFIVGIVAFSSSIAFAAKPPPTPPPPAGTECVNQGGVFPAMVYSRGIYNGGGRYTKTQFVVANSLGTCEVMVYDTGDYGGFGVEVSFHFDATSGVETLAWLQSRDNGTRVDGYVVKLAQFFVSGRKVQGLPLTATTIYRAPTTPVLASMADVELSPDGRRVAFSTNQGGGNVSAPAPQTFQVLICTLGACLAPEIAFTATTSVCCHGGTGSLTIGHSNDPAELERIYFIYRSAISPYSDGDLVAIDNLGGGTWSAPETLVDRDDYIAAMGDTDPFLDEPSALSQPDKPDRVLIQSSATFTGSLPRVDVYDSSTGNVRRFVGTGYRPSWTLAPTIDGVGPNVLVGELQHSTNGTIQEIDLDGAAQRSLPMPSGYSVDSAN